MNVWVVRAAGDTSKEQEALAAGRCIAGWDEIPDFRTLTDKAAFQKAIRLRHPYKNNFGLGVWMGQMMRFRDQIAPGDAVVMPMSSRDTLVLGVVEGDYEYGPAVEGGKPRHMRPARWVGALAKAAVVAEAQGSIGAFLTVFRVDRPGFDAQVRAVLEQGQRSALPMPGGQAASEARER